MAAGSGWMPLREPSRQGREAFHISPFNRLARVHAASSAGDVMVAVALAGSLFFSIDPTQARWRVGLYLLLTLAPFAVVAPFIGPAIDRFRGGSRWVILMTCVARGFIAYLMTRHLDGLLLFPEAFAMLVFAKGYQVARSAYVPVTVRSDTELVRANSSLALIAALAGPVGALPAGLVHVVLGSHWVVGMSMIPFAAGAVLAGKLPAPASWSLAARSTMAPGEQPPPAPPVDVPPEAVADESGFPVGSDAATAAQNGVDEGAGVGGAHELSSAASRSTPSGPDLSPEAREHSIFLAVSTMGLLRGVVGFLTFLLAFALRSKGGVAGFGLVLTAAGLGNLAGSFVAPKLRELLREDQMLTACLLTTAVVGLLAGLVGGLGAALLVVGIVGVASATGKLAFDSLVQRDARASDKGRLLAQFEARFQMLWVVGAFIPVVIPLPARVGYVLIGALAAAASISYFVLRQPLGAVVGQMTKAGAGRVIANGPESASGRPAPRSKRRRNQRWRPPDGVAPGVTAPGVTAPGVTMPPPPSTPPAARRAAPARPRPAAGPQPNSWTLPGERGDEWGRP